MMPRAIDALIDVMNSALDALNKSGYHIRDEQDAEYCLSKVRYCDKDDQIYFECEVIKNDRT